MKKTISRRNFLKNTGFILGSLFVEVKNKGLVSALESIAQEEAYPDTYLRDNGLVVLPSHGTLYVASDFHGRYNDFMKWLDKTDLISRIKNQEDVYGVLLGDATDIKKGDSSAGKDGDLKIVNTIRKIKDDLKAEKKRLIYLQGNHEAIDVQLYESLKKQGMDWHNKKKYIKELYSINKDYEQFNFIERMNDVHYGFLKNLPIAILGKQGIVCVHAGPSQKLESPKDIARRKEEVVEELQWKRPHYAFISGYVPESEFQKFGYHSKDVDAFLQKMNNSTLLITGHTTIRVLPKENVRDGVGFYGSHQVLLETSYGAEKGKGKYLALDLTRRYKDNTELKLGTEIMTSD